MQCHLLGANGSLEVLPFLCSLLCFSFQGERKCLTFYLPKFFIVGLLWLASVTLGIWQT